VIYFVHIYLTADLRFSWVFSACWNTCLESSRRNISPTSPS